MGDLIDSTKYGAQVINLRPLGNGAQQNAVSCVIVKQSKLMPLA